MRPVSQERRAPKPRVASGRSTARGVSRSAAQPRRGQNGPGFFDKVAAVFAAIFHRPLLLLTLTTVIAILVAGIWTGEVTHRTILRTGGAAGQAISRAGFVVAQVHLDGNVRTKSDAILGALGIRAGQPIFGVDVQDARARLLSLPWVGEAEVKRRFPDDISVHIVERVPYARWNSDHGLVVVERQGHVITADGENKFAKLPLLMGDGAPEHALGFIEAVSARRAIVKRVAAYQYQSGRRWNLLLDNGVVVKLPETGWEKELAELEHLIIDRGVLEKGIREIDLRNPGFYYFRLLDGGEQKEKRSETGSAI